MPEIFKWIWERPLRPFEDRHVFIARRENVLRLFAVLTENRGLFLLAPPKSGTTTFFNEIIDLAMETGKSIIQYFDGREILKTPELLNVAKVTSANVMQIVIIDDLEKIQKIEDIEKVLDIISLRLAKSIKLILSGDSRVYGVAIRAKKFPGLIEFQLLPFETNTVNHRLLLGPLSLMQASVAPAALAIFRRKLLQILILRSI